MKKSFNPEVFLDIAKTIWKDQKLDQEGRLRTAIGRSYYAAFLKSLVKLQNQGESFPSVHKIHADVRKKLQNRKKSNIASKLNSLFDMRVKADYKLYAKIDVSLYNQSIRLSENIMNWIEEL